MGLLSPVFLALLFGFFQGQSLTFLTSPAPFLPLFSFARTSSAVGMVELGQNGIIPPNDLVVFGPLLSVF